MRKFIGHYAILAGLALSACGGPPASVQEAERVGPWDLKSNSSHIRYITIKQGDIAEKNSFGLFSGSVSPSGEAEIDIALNSVMTHIDTRDERMKKFVFKTETYPSALITAKIPLSELTAMTSGERKNLQNEISVSLAGLSESFDVGFVITRLGPNKVLIETREPILVHADDFDLMAGVTTLQDLAKLESITPVVPVSFSLVFER